MTAVTIVSIYYDALREILEALAIKNNLKIYNHDCFCAFLKEILKDSNLGEDFDRFRQIRNKINYYGKAVSKAEAKELIEDMIKTRTTVIEKYLQ